MLAEQGDSGVGGGRRGRGTLMLKTDSYSHRRDVLRHLRMFSAQEIMRRVSASSEGDA